MSNYEIKPIKVEDLQFDEKNARIPTQKSQLGALTSLLKEQSLSGGKNKILNLVEDISQIGIGPHENFIVERSPHDKTKYIVLEGNRRLAALKLLNDPNLCKDLSITAVERHRKNYIKIDTVICVVLDRASAKVWIQRKHAGEMDGRGTVPWTRIQRLRSGERTKEIAILDYILDRTESPEVKELLESFDYPISNLERLSSLVLSALPYEYSDGNIIEIGETDNTYAVLEDIVADLGSGVIVVDDSIRQRKPKIC